MLQFTSLPFLSSTIGPFALTDCHPAIEIDGRAETIRWQQESAGTFIGSSPSGSWRWNCIEKDGHLTVRFSGKLNHPVHLAEIILLEIPEIQADHLYIQGLRMGGCGLKKLQDISGAEAFESFYQCILTKENRQLMFSMPLMQKQPEHFTGRYENNRITGLRCACTLKNYGGTDIEPDPLTVTAGDGFQMLTRWADDNAEEKKEFSPEPQIGWNSWDYYRWTITEEEVLKNAEFIARDPVLSRYVKKIIVDDGWQYCYGEWEANPFFPHGMEYLAKELTKMGFEPGLWFAPSIVEPHCRLAQYNPEMLGLSEGGQPCLAYECMRRHGMVLDPTVPKVQEHLRKLFDRYASMGYKYFKLDFLQSTLEAPRFHDPLVPRSEIVRKLVEPIYEGISGRTQILGCNYPFLAGSRMVNSVRVCSDIHAVWEAIRHNTVSAAARFWANRKLWLNDPDFALCRGVDTSDDPLLNSLNPCWVFISPDMPFNQSIGNYSMGTATRNEIEILLGVVLMTAGAINLSDNLPLLNDAGLDLARRLVSASPAQTARPLDLFSSNLPSYWVQQLNDGGTRLMLVNWQDQEQELPFTLAEYGFRSGRVRDFYTDEILSLPLTETSITLPPHTCRIWEQTRPA